DVQFDRNIPPAAPELSGELPVRWLLIVALEGAAPDDGIVAELFTQLIDRAFGLGGAVVEQVGEVGPIAIAKRGQADADQPEGGAVDLGREQIAAGAENDSRKLGRASKRLRPGADAKVGGLELERHRPAGEVLCLEAR